MRRLLILGLLAAGLAFAPPPPPDPGCPYVPGDCPPCQPGYHEAQVGTACFYLPYVGLVCFPVYACISNQD